jgi:serine/threonine protein kinase
MPDTPQKVGRYEIRGLVGKGAMGVVYNAVDPALGRTVAIKTLSFSAITGHEAEMRMRFLREARSAGMLQHPNIITVHELFEEAGTTYMVMELLEGAALASLLKKKKELSLGEKLSILDQIAAGLGEAHAHRIVHRDLKPSNVFVLRSGVVKVLDFGVAKTGEGELTRAGTVFGTVEYMAPEQVRGASVNPRADIFSLGVVSYEVLTGRNPFRADTLAASVFKILSDSPEKLSGPPFGVHSDIEAVVFRCLSKSEEGRFDSMADFRTELRKAADAAGVATKAPALTDEDMVVTRDRNDGASAASLEPQVSQWSHVAAQADLLEEIYQRGVEAFQAGKFADCVEKMSQVLDEVPVHSMSLHYLAVSEEKLRKERLGDRERKSAAAVLSSMRDAHRRGDASLVIEKANQFLAIDKESVEARWYRRNAEARLRAVSVGVSTGARAAGPGRSVAGTLSREGPKSFGYFPAQDERGKKRPAAVTPAVAAPRASSGAKGIWLLAGAGALFLGLVGMWLGSFGGTPPAASADPETTLPGVRTSPFDGVDEDGTVVLQLPHPEKNPFAIRQVIPTSIVAGSAVRVGLFGEGFTEDMVVSVTGEEASVLSTIFHDATHVEIEIVAPDPIPEIVLVLTDREGRRETISLSVTSE